MRLVLRDIPLLGGLQSIPLLYSALRISSGLIQLLGTLGPPAGFRAFFHTATMQPTNRHCPTAVAPGKSDIKAIVVIFSTLKQQQTLTWRAPRVYSTLLEASIVDSMFPRGSLQHVSMSAVRESVVSLAWNHCAALSPS